MDLFYWVGFEDGFADKVTYTVGLSPKARWAYTKGFYAGRKARGMAANS